jgi:hypothetical protein
LNAVGLSDKRGMDEGRKHGGKELNAFHLSDAVEVKTTSIALRSAHQMP